MRIEHREHRRHTPGDHGYIIIGQTYTWAWLTNVACRKNDLWVRYGAGTHWEYAPVHVAVTQEYP